MKINKYQYIYIHYDYWNIQYTAECVKIMCTRAGHVCTASAFSTFNTCCSYRKCAPNSRYVTQLGDYF